MSTGYVNLPIQSGGGGVSSLNTLTGDLALTSDDGSIAITSSSTTIDLSAVASAAFLKIDGTNTPSAAMDWGGQVLTNLADPSTPQGAVTVAYLDAHAALDSFTIMQPDLGTSPTATAASDTLTFTSSDSSLTITGNSSTKTLNFQVPAITKGNLTDVGTDGIVVTGGTNAVLGSGTSIAQHVADTTHNGYLSSTDWNTFNGKQASGNYITALTGDVTASGPGSSAATLASTAVTAGSYTNTNLTVDAKGRITAASSGSAGGGVTTVGAFSASSQANGATISSTTITFGPADATNPGLVKASGSQTLNATLTLPQITTHSNSTTSTSTGTGAVVITGGLGIGDGLFSAGATNLSSGTIRASTSANTIGINTAASTSSLMTLFTNANLNQFGSLAKGINLEPDFAGGGYAINYFGSPAIHASSTAMVNYYADNMTKASGTLTAAVQFAGCSPTQGTNNTFLMDITAGTAPNAVTYPTGNWFINQAGSTYASKFAGSLVIGTTALLTTATDGFVYIPTCAGTPTGVPTTQTGTAAAVYDSSNNKFYVYNSGWKGVVLS